MARSRRINQGIEEVGALSREVQASGRAVGGRRRRTRRPHDNETPGRFAQEPGGGKTWVTAFAERRNRINCMHRHDAEAAPRDVEPRAPRRGVNVPTCWPYTLALLRASSYAKPAPPHGRVPRKPRHAAHVRNVPRHDAGSGNGTNPAFGSRSRRPGAPPPAARSRCSAPTWTATPSPPATPLRAHLRGPHAAARHRGPRLLLVRRRPRRGLRRHDGGRRGDARSAECGAMRRTRVRRPRWAPTG
mmetsp:Transcript_27188/g.68183  ORF Transcript_27188/g.68183 Transcript_27188/m.68183 type:complete len:245 (+) Transcript_27188:64-798(+)